MKRKKEEVCVCVSLWEKKNEQKKKKTKKKKRKGVRCVNLCVSMGGGVKLKKNWIKKVRIDKKKRRNKNIREEICNLNNKRK